MTTQPLDGDPLDQSVDHPLIGHRVRVVTARKGSGVDRSGRGLPLAADQYIVGRLVRVDASGGFDIRRDIDGKMRYCWPALEITAEPA